MKLGLIIVFLYSLWVLELTGALTQQQQHHGFITPKLTMVATVDDKAFFVDTTTTMTRAQALTYCTTLGMRLAEITSARQFLALDEAVVGEWVNGSCVWTGGVETSGILRYGWESSSLGLNPSYIPYVHRLDEISNYFLFFRKYVKGSYLQNGTPVTTCPGTLCETLSKGSQNSSTIRTE